MGSADTAAREQLLVEGADREQADYFRVELRGHLAALNERTAAVQRTVLSYRTRTDAPQIDRAHEALELVESERRHVQRMLASLQHHFPPDQG